MWTGWSLSGIVVGMPVLWYTFNSREAIKKVLKFRRWPKKGNVRILLFEMLKNALELVCPKVSVKKSDDGKCIYLYFHSVAMCLIFPENMEFFI